MGALSARAIRKEMVVSSFLKSLSLQERAEFDEKVEGWCLLLRYVVVDYIQRFNTSISGSPDFCFSNGDTSREQPDYSTRYHRIYIKEGERIFSYNHGR